MFILNFIVFFLLKNYLGMYYIKDLCLVAFIAPFISLMLLSIFYF